MDFKPLKIGKFLLLEKLATGGMAEVYRAKASGAGGFEKRLAVKLILPNYASREEFRQMFEYEARLSSMLTHSNIVQIYDFVKNENRYLLAMEYVDGKNLRQVINKIKNLNLLFPTQYAVYFVNEICRGLEYAHKRKDDLLLRPLNIIHRDMSPQNVMVSYDGAVKIVDFGIAKAKDRVHETQSGVIKGKFAYMSPEQAKGQTIDHRTDIFSTGIILYELLTLRRMFEGENDMATLRRVQNCEFTPPTQHNPRIPAALEKILLKSLAKEPDARYQSAGDFQRDLQEFLNRNFASFSQKDLSDLMQKIFQEEIVAENRRFEQVHRQSIPYSQGTQESRAEIDEIPDGDITRSESIEITSVTQEERLDKDSEPSQEKIVLEAPNPAGAVSPQARTVVTNPSTEHPTAIEKSGENLFREEIASPAPSADSPGEATSVSNEVSVAAVSHNNKTPSASFPPPLVTLQRVAEKPLQNSPSQKSIKVNTKNASHASSMSPLSASQKLELESRSISTNKVTLQLVPKTPAPKPFIIEEPIEPEPQPRGNDFLIRASFVVLIVAAFCSFEFYKSGTLPMLVASYFPKDLDKSRTVAAAPESGLTEKNSPRAIAKAKGDCLVYFTSLPAGATILLDDEAVGKTPQAVSMPCNKPLTYTLKLNGYLPYVEKIKLQRTENEASRILTKIPTGTLRFILSRNADVYIDQDAPHTVMALTPTPILVQANKKLRVHFVNKLFKIDEVHEYSVEQDRIQNQKVQLIEQASDRKWSPNP